MPLVDLPLRSAVDPAPRRLARAARLLLLALLALVLWRSRPPAARGADAPPEEFSAARARHPRPVAWRRRAAAGGEPRGGGLPRTAAGRAARARPRAGGRARLGLQSRGGVRRDGEASPSAQYPGGGGGPGLLLVAHTDSVAAPGPGAADDGAGVVVLLETARALLTGIGPRRPVSLLFTDAEEAGLLGPGVRRRARRSRASPPRWRRCSTSRRAAPAGSTTSSRPARATPACSASPAVRCRAPRRARSSRDLRRLPQRHRLLGLQRAGLTGLNFAFIGEPLRYHTPRDEPSRLDPGTLQHQGDHLLAATRALARARRLDPGPGRRVFFDLLGFVLLAWPEGWSMPLALVGLALVLLAGGRRAALGPGGLALGLLALLVPVALAAGAGWALHALLGALGAFPWAWVAWLGPPTLAFAALGALVARAVRLFRRVDPWSLWSGLWLGWSLLALALAAVAPGASHLAIVPLFAAGLAGQLGRRGSPPPALAVLLPLVVAGALWLPLAWMLPTAMGMSALVAVTAIVALAASPAAGALAAARARELRAPRSRRRGRRRRLPRPAALFTPDRPQPASLRLVEQESAGGPAAPALRQALWVLDPAAAPLPPALAGLRPFARRAVLPWSRAEARAAPAPVQDLRPCRSSSA